MSQLLNNLGVAPTATAPAFVLPRIDEFGPGTVPIERELESVPFDMPSETDAAFFQTSENLEERDALQNEARLNAALEPLGGTFARDNREVADMLDGRGSGAFGFTETADEVLNLYEGIHGQGRVKVFEDTDGGILDPRFYVSLQRDDGSFTPFSSPMQDLSDYSKAIGATIGYDTVATTGTVATAFATAAAVTKTIAVTAAATTATGVGAVVGVPLAIAAPVVGSLTFAYMLYAGGGTVEKYKQEVLKDKLGLSDEEADATQGFIEQSLETIQKGYTPTALGGDEFTPGEKIAGLFELGGGLIGGIIDKVRLTLGRRGRKFVEGVTTDSSVRQSAVQSQALAKATQAVPGSDDALFEGVDVTLTDQTGKQVTLGGLTAIDITDNQIIQRLGALSSQTSVIIPTKIREASQSATDYLLAMKDNFGGGDFKQFRDDLDALQDFHSKNRDNSPAYRQIGESIEEVDKLFRALRFKEAEVLYDRVFDAIGNKSYDLSSIDAAITKTTRAVIPEKDETVGAAQMAFQRGEAGIYDTVEILKTIGTSKDGMLLSGQGVRNAIKAFNEANPGYEIAADEALLNSPAKLLQMFATRFGEMGADLSVQPSLTRAQREAITTAKEMRNALLDLIGNPNNMDDAAKAAIQQDLKDANAFYKETFDVTEGATTSAKGLIKPYDTEPGQFARDILEKGRNVSQEVMLESIAKQEDYVLSQLGRASVYENPAAMAELRRAFDELIQVNLARTLPGGPGEPVSPTGVRDFLAKFSDEEQALLGLTKQRRAEILAEADQLAQVGSGDFIKVVGREAERTSPFLVRFEKVFESGDVNDNLAKLLAVASAETAGTGAVENLQKGFMDYLVSTQSGVLKRITNPTPYQRVGTASSPNYTIDTVELGKILDKALEAAPNLEKFMTPQQIKMLEGLQMYTATINRAGPDAGAALAGAQIIGELFTIDPRKFVDGLTRLASQQRISSLLTNDTIINAAVGLGARKNAGGFADTVKTYFTGYGAIGALISNIAVNPASEDEQTNRILGQPSDSQLLGNLGIN